MHKTFVFYMDPVIEAHIGLIATQRRNASSVWLFCLFFKIFPTYFMCKCVCACARARIITMSDCMWQLTRGYASVHMWRKSENILLESVLSFLYVAAQDLT